MHGRGVVVGGRPTLASASSPTPLLPACSKELVDDIFAFALKKQTGVSLKYM
jgi:hypothetical protein